MDQRSGTVSVSSQYTQECAQRNLPGEWLNIKINHPAALRIEQGSQVLADLSDLKTRRAIDKEGAEIPWIRSGQADLVFACIIVMYAFLTGYDIELTVASWPDVPSHTIATAMLIAQALFVVIFIVELGLRVRADGLWFCVPCSVRIRNQSSDVPSSSFPLEFISVNPSGFFDTAIIVIGALEIVVGTVGLEAGSLAAAGPMRLLRLLRLVRIIRLLNFSDQLRQLIKGMSTSISAVFWAFVLLFVLMYLGALLCVILLSKETDTAVEGYFGTVPSAIWTHFQIITMEAWPDISDSVIAATGQEVWFVYFIFFICLSGMALMNLVTGVVCEKLMVVTDSGGEENTAIDYHALMETYCPCLLSCLPLSWQPQPIKDEKKPLPVEAYAQASKKFKAELLVIFAHCDIDGSSTIDCAEFASIVRGTHTPATAKMMKELFDAMSISEILEPESMFEVLDEKGAGSVSFDHLAESMLRLRGSQDRCHSLMLQHDLARVSKRELQRLEELKANLTNQDGIMKANLAEVEALVERELTSLESLLNKSAVEIDAELQAELQAAAGSVEGAIGVKDFEAAKGDPCKLATDINAGDKSHCSPRLDVKAREEKDATLASVKPRLRVAQEPQWSEETARLEQILSQLDGLNQSAKHLFDVPYSY